MRETIIALTITALIATATIQAINHGQHVADLENAITVLERELEHNQIMLDDAKRIIPLIERRVATIDTEMSVREVIWHLQEAIGDCEKVEVY